MAKKSSILQFILSLLLSFYFNFGYSLLLNKIMILIVDYLTTWFTFDDNIAIKKFLLFLLKERGNFVAKFIKENILIKL